MGPMTCHLRVVSLLHWCIPIMMAVLSARDTSGDSIGSGRQKHCHVGQNVTLHCHTNLDADVDWTYQSSQTESESFVYSNGVIYKLFRTRLTIGSPTNGDYNLIIVNVRLSDAGQYFCVEDGGYGTRHPVELIVNGDESEHATTAVMTSTSESTNFTTTSVLVVVVFVVIVILVIIVVVLCVRKWSKREHKNEAYTCIEREQMIGIKAEQAERPNVSGAFLKELRGAASVQISTLSIKEERSKRCVVGD